MVKKILLTLFLIFVFACISSGSRPFPKISFSYSQNREYKLIVYPLEYIVCDTIFDGKTPKETRQLRKQIREGDISYNPIITVPCRAALYRSPDSDSMEVWSKILPLVNYSAPVKTIVANDGKSVVMIDDWFSRGFSHVIVIYDENGEMIRDFSLEDISPFSLEQYSALISGRYWGSHAEYLDNNRVEIRFRNKNGEEKTRVFNIEERAFEDEISISLQ